MPTPLRDAELWRRVLDARLSNVHTALPGKVVSFNASAQTIDVQPQIQNVVIGEETEVAESYPKLLNVPVIYPRTAKTMVAFPLEAGDIVTLVFNEWPIDVFREKGIEGHPVDLDRHSLGSAVAIPGGPFPNSDPIGETVDGVLVGYDGGMLLKIKSDGTVELSSTGGAMQAVALADDVKAELDALRNALNTFISTYDTHIHVTTATVGLAPPAGTIGVISPTTSTGTPANPINDVGSTKVEVEE